MKTRVFILMVAMATVLFASCEQSEIEELVSANSKSVDLEGNVATHVFTTSIDDLTQTDIDGLLLMREEEKMARDVYTFFYEAYGVQVFDRISNSEGQHSSSVLSLIEYFGLTDPAVAEVGVFTNPDIQALYNQLTTAGSTIELALSTGAFIEEYDIADLQKLITATKNTDIIMVYTNLENGSDNHLRAFTNTLATYGIIYEPQILSVDVYAQILSETNGNGSKGKRGNNGNGGNGGNRTVTNIGIDANGDGLCDTTGLPVGQNQVNANQGKKGNGRN